MPIRPATHRASGQARRTALLEAAVDELADKGVAGATHRSIAARAGMSTSTTSYFFSSLDDLVAAALEVVGERIVARVDGVIAQVSDSDLGPQESIERFVDAVLSEPEVDTVAQFEIYLECARRPQLRDTAHRIMASIERGAEASLRALGIQQAPERAPLVVGILDGLALHRRARPLGDQLERQVLTAALEALYRGFVAADLQEAAGASPASGAATLNVRTS
jgi:DNA-binding transcriptional regulator YbjK